MKQTRLIKVEATGMNTKMVTLAVFDPEGLETRIVQEIVPMQIDLHELDIETLWPDGTRVENRIWFGVREQQYETYYNQLLYVGFAAMHSGGTLEDVVKAIDAGIRAADGSKTAEYALLLNRMMQADDKTLRHFLAQMMFIIAGKIAK